MQFTCGLCGFWSSAGSLLLAQVQTRRHVGLYLGMESESPGPKVPSILGIGVGFRISPVKLNVSWDSWEVKLQLQCGLCGIGSTAGAVLPAQVGIRKNMAGVFFLNCYL